MIEQDIVEKLDPLYEGMTTGLNFGNPLQLLVATILSAQCTDERVNIVTPQLFARFKTAEDYASANRGEMEEMIHSCGFFRNKTKNIQGATAAIRDRYGGEVPGTMEDLLTLPGVARKTANVVLYHAFNKHEGVAVDTHVARLSQRLGLTAEKDPNKIERDLMRRFPQSHWGRISDLLIWHGRRVCFARNRQCTVCPLNHVCPSSLVPELAAQSTQ